MTKRLSAAVLSAALAAFAAGRLSVSQPEAPLRVHALRLRASLLEDGGTRVFQEAYASRWLTDGGWRDVQEGDCYALPDQACALTLLGNAAHECVWRD